MIRNKKILKAGDVVEVLPYQEILLTLDDKGTLDGLPFMPEMKKFCGQQFRIHKRAQLVCIDGKNLHGIKDTVFLDRLRCDGTFHEGCKKNCTLLWKEAWLKEVTDKESIPYLNGKDAPIVYSDFPTKFDDRFFCQSTEMKHVTFEIESFKKIYLIINILLKELVSKDTKKLEILRDFLLFVSWKLLRRISFPGRKKLTGDEIKTPVASLGLKAGDRVRVKSKEEIKKTLNKSGFNRGLRFSDEMQYFCGREFIVKEKLDTIISENSGKMVEIKNTIILEGVFCKGRCDGFGCFRNMYHYWREIWLERV